MEKMRKLLIITIAILACTGCRAGVRRYRAEVVKEYDHDAGAYTQGLFFHGDRLYESTGQYGESSFRQVELSTGKVLRRLDFGRKYFAEGSAILDGKIYILTWTNKLAFVYDAGSLEYLKTYSYPREGWGLTSDGSSLIASDGSARLYFLSPELKLERSVNVTLNGRPLRFLNELEWIGGRIWANVYTTEMIVVINPRDGKVEATIDCSGLLPNSLKEPSTDVLNGIAVDQDGKIYLTGKNWPRLYEVVLKEVR